MENTNSLQLENKALAEKMTAFNQFGCFLSVLDGELYECIMLTDGSPDTEEDGEFNWLHLTAPESQEFLDAVNAHFGTKFRMSQFAGR
jgi:hypothetical protein